MQKPKVGWHLTDDELSSLRHARGGLEWEVIKSQIKQVRSGELPPDWFDQVIASGLIQDKIQKWTGPSNTFLFSEWRRDVYSSNLE